MIHPTAEVDSRARIGAGTRVWHQAQVREDAEIGHSCTIGKGVYIDVGVRVGNFCKIQNGALVYRGTTLEDGVFVGPQACLLNDHYPRAITPEGRPKTDADWECGRILIRHGASIGASATILPNVTVGEFALVGAGTTVTRNVPGYTLVLGIPARIVGYVCRCGRRLDPETRGETENSWICSEDGRRYRLANGVLVASASVE